VDFGLHQGGVAAECRNRRMPPLDPTRLDAVVLTHGHLDHCGRLPLLPLNGYSGPIYSTLASCDLTEIILRDSASIQETDAQRMNRERARRGKRVVQPLYTSRDVEPVLRLLRPIEYERAQQIAPGISVRLVDAGHILGSASVEMTVTEGGQSRIIAFSGDIGDTGAALLRDPTNLTRADFVVMESTYGDRDHKGREESLAELLDVLGQAHEGGGKVLIPSFAVGRTQQLIYYLGQFAREGRLTGTRVFVDSPMALSATELYRRHREAFDDEAWAIINRGDKPLDFPDLRFTRTAQESAALNPLDGGVIIISASGMCTGGRILHHLRHNLPRPGTCVIFVGFQAKGTLGRRLVEGAKVVRIMGEEIPVRARMHTIGGFSAHAGQAGLMKWAAAFKGARPRLFLTHGEPPTRLILGQKISKELGMHAGYPLWGDRVELSGPAR
jgi:metallo-beta-lactamase family protein